MAAETNLGKSADYAKVQNIDFVATFTQNIKQLQDILGITRKVEKVPGQVIKTYKVTGTLQDGTVAEGETIPLSSYKTTVADTFELVVKKWRKATSLESINDKGYEQAVSDTDDKMLLDIQGGIKSSFFTFLGTGTGAAAGTTLQKVLANTQAQLQIKYEDLDNDGFIYFVNPLDIAGYLGDKDVTIQTAFGFTYVKSFLGLFDVAVYSKVPQGKVYGTAKNNVILYYSNPSNSELAKAFEFTTDTTGYVGIHHTADYTNMTFATEVLAGIALYAELIDGIVIGTVAAG